MAVPDAQVQEMQGLYGPFTITERVVQKIWLHKDFALAEARLLDGSRLQIRSPGRWNLLGGPDFRDARLVIDGREVSGDVEVHFHATDWRAHGHAADPAYGGVVLHVVMFPPREPDAIATTIHGARLPTLVLLPLLHRSLEELASDDALERLTARDSTEWLAELARRPPAELRQMLALKAGERWRQKVHYARLRIQRLGWEEAAHHTALEILGYRHNRAPMLALATQHPLAEWRRGLDVEHAYRALKDDWQQQGVRPANHPRRRLAQYAAWVRQVPDWPQRLLGHVAKLPAPDLSEPVVANRARKHLRLTTVREEWLQGLTGGVLDGTRFDNLVCDGLLPLATAGTGGDLFSVWFHWFVGDTPAEIRRAMGTAGLAGPGAGPRSHGLAQGLLAWIIAREAGASG
jgi:hypothetical protein